MASSRSSPFRSALRGPAFDDESEARSDTYDILYTIPVAGNRSFSSDLTRSQSLATATRPWTHFKTRTTSGQRRPLSVQTRSISPVLIMVTSNCLAAASMAHSAL